MTTSEWGGYWWAAVPSHRRPDDPESRAFLDKVWREPHGDRRQEIVLIGSGMDQENLTAMFDAALLTPFEMQRGVKYWAKLPDPFPIWGPQRQTVEA